MKVEPPEFNDIQRAFFSFPIFVDDHMLDNETVAVAVSRTTGFVETLLTPRNQLNKLKNFTLKPLLSTEQLTSSIKQISPILKWDQDYSEDDAVEKLTSAFVHTESEQHVKGINAMTGEQIVVD